MWMKVEASTDSESEWMWNKQSCCSVNAVTFRCVLQHCSSERHTSLSGFCWMSAWRVYGHYFAGRRWSLWTVTYRKRPKSFCHRNARGCTASPRQPRSVHKVQICFTCEHQVLSSKIMMCELNLGKFLECWVTRSLSFCDKDSFDKMEIHLKMSLCCSDKSTVRI